MRFSIFGLVHDFILGRSLVSWGRGAHRCHPREPGPIKDDAT